MKKHLTSYNIARTIIAMQVTITIVWSLCVALVYGEAPFERDHLYLLLFFVFTFVSIKLVHSKQNGSYNIIFSITGLLLTLLIVK